MLADDSTVPALTDSTRTLSLAGVPGQWAFPAADTLVGMKVAARGFRQEDRAMSYTLRGRVETRLAAAVLPFLVAAVLSPILHKWWPLELAGLMLGIGLALDVTVYHRLLPYQPGWAALPLGLLELGLTMAAARLLEREPAPLRRARLLRRLVARAPGAGARRPAAAAAHAGPRTAASSAAPARRSQPPRRSRCSRSSGRLGQSSRRPSASRPGSTRGRSSSTTRRR